MSIRTLLINGIALTGLAASSVSFAAAGDCAAVYGNATRNITLLQKQQTELSYYFTQHCHKSGEVNDSSLSVGVDVIVKAIPFNFSGTSTDSKKKLEEFCKVGVERNYFSSAQTDFRDEVVAASLNSFNQCLGLESRGLRVTHQEQAPQSVLIYAELTNAFTSASLDAITYSDSAISCKSTGFTADGKAIALTGDESLKITKNFTIACTRKPKAEDGKTHYPRAVVGLSTSLGPYTVELIEDQLYGFMLASQAKKNNDTMARQKEAAIQERDAAIAREKAIEDRLARVSVDVKMISTGEYDPPSTQFFRPREYCGTDVGAWARAQCGTAEAKVHHIGGYGGNKCGYQHYVVTCLKKP